MYKGKLISADFEESTMEFEIEHEFSIKAGQYIIFSVEDYEKQLFSLAKYVCEHQSSLDGKTAEDYTKDFINRESPLTN